jgi:Protein of unknown function (DUF1552)
MRTRPLDRRTFLRGAAGVAVGLPVLEIMLDSRGRAYASTGAPIVPRYLVAFAGASLGADFDPLDNLFVPNTSGPNYDLKVGTATLANHGNVKDQVTIVSGLRIPYKTGATIPLGGWAQDFHTQALGPLICGVRNQAVDDYDVNGVTSDQVVATALGNDTTFRSLQYQVQASWYLTVSAPYGRDILSYRAGPGDSLIEMPGQTSPKAAYDALFTSFIPPDDGDAQAKALDLLKRQSVIDLVRADYEALIPRLGRADQLRLEQHLDELRDLETQLAAESPDTSPTCFQYPDPGADPPIGGNQEAAYGYNFDINSGWSDETTRAERFADLIHMAFTCDLTRSVALLYTMAQSHLNCYEYTGQPYDQHELGHSGLGTETFSAVHAWHLDLFGGLVARLRDTPEGDGSVLDSCALVLLFEGGHGFDPGSGNPESSHSTENMAVCVAGGAGGLVQGQHLVATGYHPVNVLNTAMHAVGVEEDLGEVVGEIPGLRA